VINQFSVMMMTTTTMTMMMMMIIIIIIIIIKCLTFTKYSITTKLSFFCNSLCVDVK